eukprot:412676-Rhodomonas_salina.1
MRGAGHRRESEDSEEVGFGERGERCGERTVTEGTASDLHHYDHGHPRRQGASFSHMTSPDEPLQYWDLNSSVWVDLGALSGKPELRIDPPCADPWKSQIFSAFGNTG